MRNSKENTENPRHILAKFLKDLTGKSHYQIKKELDDGSFNTKNAEGHQLESYQKLYQNKAKTITANTPQGDVFNIHSQLQTVDRIIKEKELGYVKKAELEDKK